MANALTNFRIEKYRWQKIATNATTLSLNKASPFPVALLLLATGDAEPTLDPVATSGAIVFSTPYLTLTRSAAVDVYARPLGDSQPCSIQVG